MNLVCAHISVCEEGWSKNREEREREKRGERETDRQRVCVNACGRQRKHKNGFLFKEHTTLAICNVCAMKGVHEEYNILALALQEFGEK